MAYLAIRRRLGHRMRRAGAGLGKAGRTQLGLQLGTIKPLVHHARHVTAVKAAILRIQVGQRQPATRREHAVEGAQQCRHIGDVMHRHAAEDQLEALGRRRLGSEIEHLRKQVVDPGHAGFFLQHREHAERHVAGQ